MDQNHLFESYFSTANSLILVVDFYCKTFGEKILFRNLSETYFEKSAKNQKIEKMRYLSDFWRKSEFRFPSKFSTIKSSPYKTVIPHFLRFGAKMLHIVNFFSQAWSQVDKLKELKDQIQLRLHHNFLINVVLKALIK